MEDVKTNAHHEAGHSLPTDEEAWLLSQALARAEARQPSVDEAWHRFEQQARPARVRPLWRRVAAAVAVAAAVCAFVWLMPRISVSVDGTADSAVTVLHHADAEPPTVTMTRETTAWRDDEHAPTTHSPQATTSAVTQEVVDFAQPTATAGHSDDAGDMPSVVLMTTPRGKDCHLTLSDGTRVWMNADSRLQFPEQFGPHRRTVRLTGEAYFEVAHDARRPFVVESNYLTATVLGTTFNMRAYCESDASVALIEGRVAVQAQGSSAQPVVVSPGQQVSLSGQRRSLSVSHVDTYGFTQRKDGFFYFHDATMRQIMIELGRWYNKTVVFENADHIDMRLHFVAERSLSLPQIINRLCEIDGVDIALGANDITVF